MHVIKTFFLLLCWSASVAGAVFAAPVSHFSPVRPYCRLLVICSTSRSNEDCQLMVSGAERVLLDRDIPYTIENLALNVTIDDRPDIWHKRIGEYLPYIEKGSYDVILVVSDEACRALESFLPQVPSKTSCVLLNVSDERLSAFRHAHANTTGIIRRDDVVTNLKLAFSLFPHAKEMIVISSSFRRNPVRLETLRKVLPERVSVKIRMFDNASPETKMGIAYDLRRLPDDSCVISTDWDRFFATRASRDNMWRWLRRQYGGPIFVWNDMVLPHAFGGNVLNPTRGGQVAGDFIARIAAGLQAGDIHPVEFPTALVFNAKEMLRFAVPAKKLPAGASVINPEKGLIARHPRFFMLALFSFTLFVGILLGAGLIARISYLRRRLERLAIGSLPIRMSIFNRDGDILYSRLEQAAGPVESGVKRSRVEDLPWVDSVTFIEKLRKVCDTGERMTFDYSCYGHPRAAILTRLENAGPGGSSAVLCVSFETERFQQALNEARRFEERYHQTLRSIDDAIVTVDAEERITGLNPAAELTLGCSAEEVLGLPLDDVFKLSFSDKAVRRVSPLREAILKDVPVRSNGDVELCRADGTVRRIIYNAAPFRSSDGSLLGGILVFRDETADVAQRMELDEAVQLLRQVSDFANFSLVRIDIKKGVAPHPLMRSRMKFWPYRDGLPISLKEWVHPEDAPLVLKQAEAFTSGHCDNVRMRFRTVYAGHNQTYLFQGGRSKQNSHILFGVIQDISIEEVERERNEDYRQMMTLLYDKIPQPVFIKDGEDFRYLLANAFFAGQFGLKPAEIIGKTDYDLFADGTEAGNLRANDREVLRTGVSTDYVETYHDASGNLYTCRTRKSVAQRLNGHPVLLGMSLDQAETKAVSARLEREQDLFAAVLDHLPLGVFVKDGGPDFRYLAWNREMTEQTGFAASDVIGRTDDCFGLSAKQLSERVANDRNVAAGGGVRNIRVIADSPTHGHRVFETNLSSFSCAGNKVLFGVRMEVSALENARNDLSMHRRRGGFATSILSALLNLHEEDDPGEVILRVSAELFGADSAAVYRYDEKTGQLTSVSAWRKLSTRRPWNGIDLSSAPDWQRRLFSGKIIRSGLMVDPAAASGEIGEFLTGCGITAYAVIPLQVDDRFFGVMAFNSTSNQHRCADTDADLLLDSARFWMAANARRQKAETAVAETALRALAFDWVSVPLALYSTDSRILAANRAFLDFWKQEAKTVIGRPCQDWCPAAPRACREGECPLTRVSSTLLPDRQMTMIEGRSVESVTIPVLDAERHVRYFTQYQLDQTAFTREGEGLKSDLRRATLLWNCLADGLDSENSNIYQAVVIRIAQFFDARAVVLKQAATVNTGIKGDVLAEYFSEKDADYQKLVKGADASRFPSLADHVLSGHDVVMNRGLLPADAEDWQHELSAYLKEAGSGGILLLQIRIRGVFLAWLVIESHLKGRPFDSSDLAFGNELGRLFAALHDSEYKRAQLNRDQTFLKLIFDSLSLPLILLDGDRSILAANTAMHAFCKKVLTIPVNQDRPDLGLIEDPRIQTLIDDACQSGVARNLELNLFGFRSRLRAVSIRKGGRIVRIILSADNRSTESETANEAMRRAFSALTQLASEKSAYIAAFGEELEQALALLPESKNKPIMQTLRDVIALCRIEANDRPPSAEALPTAELLREITGRYEQTALDKGLTYEVQVTVDASLPALLFNREDFDRVLSQLLENALHFTTAGGIWVSCARHLNEEGVEELLLTVRDTGRGIPAGRKSLLFNPYTGEHDSVAFNLAVVDRLVRRYGGRITVQSESGKGTCFSLMLPSRAVEKAANPVPARAAADNKSILIVDDVPMNLKVLSALLTRMGFEPHAVGSGQEALEALKTFTPRCVLTDIWMPEINGVELARRIQHSAGDTPLAVYAVTADAESGKSFDMSVFRGTIIKPVTMAKLQTIFPHWKPETAVKQGPKKDADKPHQEGK